MRRRGRSWASRRNKSGGALTTSRIACVSTIARAGRGDGPLEGTDRQAGRRVVEALDGEAPGGAGEATRTARDGRGFHDQEVEDAVDDHWRGEPSPVGGQLVAVGRHDVIDSFPGAGR